MGNTKRRSGGNVLEGFDGEEYTGSTTIRYVNGGERRGLR